MVWVQLDDQFPEHPKIAVLSDAAFRSQVMGICYCNRLLTDGFVPTALAHGWGRRAARELVAAGLWDVETTGYRLHDFEDWNKSRAQVEAERDEKRAQRSAAGKARAASAQRVAGRFAGPPLADRDQPTPLPNHSDLVVGVDPVPDTPTAVGNRGEAAPEENGNGHKPFHLADVVNLHLVVSLKDRYRRRKPWDGVTEGLLTGLVLGGKKSPAYGARAVNAAIEDLYENAAGVSNPAGYLRERAESHAAPLPDSSSSSDSGVRA